MLHSSTAGLLFCTNKVSTYKYVDKCVTRIQDPLRANDVPLNAVYWLKSLMPPTHEYRIILKVMFWDIFCKHTKCNFSLGYSCDMTDGCVILDFKDWCIDTSFLLHLYVGVDIVLQLQEGDTPGHACQLGVC